MALVGSKIDCEHMSNSTICDHAKTQDQDLSAVYEFVPTLGMDWINHLAAIQLLADKQFQQWQDCKG